MKKRIISGLAVMAAVACQPNTSQSDVEETTDNCVVETLMTRRSVRDYNTKNVSRADIDEIVKCGIHAPSALNKQSWEVRIVDDPQFIEETREIYLRQDSSRIGGVSHTFPNASVYLFVANDTLNSWSPMDCGLLCGNITNAAWAKGLGTVIMGSTARAFNDMPELAEFVGKLGFSENYAPIVVIALGYPNESPKVKQRDTTKVKYIEPVE